MKCDIRKKIGEISEEREIIEIRGKKKEKMIEEFEKCEEKGDEIL